MWCVEARGQRIQVVEDSCTIGRCLEFDGSEPDLAADEHDLQQSRWTWKLLRCLVGCSVSVIGRHLGDALLGDENYLPILELEREEWRFGGKELGYFFQREGA